MKVNIGYFTKFGNNKNISEKLGELLREKGAEAEVFSVAEKQPASMVESDIYVFSSPTRMGNPPGKIKRFVKKCNVPAGAGYAVVNSTGGPEQSKVLSGIGSLCEEKGMKKAAEGVILQIKDMKGPLEAGYEKKLNSLADTLMQFHRE